MNKKVVAILTKAIYELLALQKEEDGFALSDLIMDLMELYFDWAELS